MQSESDGVAASGHGLPLSATLSVMGQPTMHRPPILRGREAMMVADCLVPDAQRAASAITVLVNQVGRYERALREIRMLTVEVGDSVESASRACAIAMEALDE